VTGLLVLLGGLLNFVMLYALGEIILLQIAVEENTRLTAALLLKMHQDTQPEPAAPAAAYPPSGALPTNRRLIADPFAFLPGCGGVCEGES
jgi:hypothetical protein